MGHETTYAVQQIAAYSITSSAVASSVCGMLRPSTLDAVAERAGISKGGLVYSFATKDGLVRAALEREVTRFQGAVRQPALVATTLFWNDSTAMVASKRTKQGVFAKESGSTLELF
jgi:hypothetical protein